MVPYPYTTRTRKYTKLVLRIPIKFEVLEGEVHSTTSSISCMWPALIASSHFFLQIRNVISNATINVHITKSQSFFFISCFLPLFQTIPSLFLSPIFSRFFKQFKTLHLPILDAESPNLDRRRAEDTLSSLCM